MTFTVHNDQADIIKDALQKASGLGGESGLNENRNGNALTYICSQFIPSNND